MTSSSIPVDVETLLAHRDFVRAVVRRLLRDENAVEDVVQETYLAAIRHPGLRVTGLRAWLARVARNFAFRSLRRRSRRRRRERAVARPEESSSSAASLVEQMEWQRRLVQAVLDLAEPYRSTVIRRFFRDERPLRIARDLGIPAATVRTRVHRALEMLRRRLETEGGSDRGRWTVALLPVLATRTGPPVAAATGGALPMCAPETLLLGAILLLALVGGVLLLTPGSEGPRNAVPDQEVAVGVEQTGEPDEEDGDRDAPSLAPRPLPPGGPPDADPDPAVPAWTHKPAVGALALGTDRGPSGQVPPGLRAPRDPQPPAMLPSHRPIPGFRNLPAPTSPGPRPEIIGFDHWIFWWSYARDEILYRRVRQDASSVPGGDRDRVVGALLAFLESDDVRPEARAAAASALGRLGEGRERLRALASAAVTGPERTLRRAALLALGRGPEARSAERDVLLQILADPSERVRVRGLAAVTLGLAGGRDPRSWEALAAQIDEPVYDEIAACAMLGAGLLPDPRAGAGLADRLGREPPPLRRPAPSRPAKPVESARPSAPSPPARLGLPPRPLPPTAPPAVPERVPDRPARTKHAEAFWYAFLVEGIGESGDRAAETSLRKLAREGNLHERRSALLALGKLSSDPTPALERLTAEPDATGRGFAAVAAARIAARISSPDLRKNVRSALEKAALDDKEEAGGYAAVALGLLGERQALAALRTKLMSAETAPWRKAACAIGIGLLGDEASAADLEDLLEDAAEPSHLRAAAATGLGLIGDAVHREALLRAVSAPDDAAVLTAALPALALVGGPDATRTLLDLLERPYGNGRTLCATAVGLTLLRDGTTVEPLLSILTDPERPDPVRAAAAAALGGIFDPEAVPGLARLASDRNHRAMLPTIDCLLLE